jgi:hypothetical protein
MIWRMPRLPVLLVLLVATTLSCGRQAEQCWVCKREIHAQVRSTLTLSNGKKVPACCPRCALHYQEEPEHPVRAITVTDYATGASLPFGKAYLVEGSDETPCVHHPNVMDDTHMPMQACYDRCMPSLIAFGTADQARDFMTDHGGSLFEPGAFPGLPASPK